MEIQVRYGELSALRGAVELLCSEHSGTKNSRPVFLPVALAGKVARIRRLCREAWSDYEELRTKLIHKHGTQGPDGSFGVSTKGLEFLSFREELKELDAMTFTIDRPIRREEIEAEFESISPIVLDGLESVFAASEPVTVTSIETAAGRRKAR